ncbi:MAG: hypothetical protein LBP65_01915 [Puniceicoccales bacterium]|nr:hypothetical protein [Puniceicoccales bacterium]
MFRLQQLDRDLLGCLKNTREETEELNTELPPTEARRGRMALWGMSTGRLTYAGDPDAGDDPTADFLKTYNNLADVVDIAAAKVNLHIVEGHVVNGLIQRPNLIVTGDAVSTVDVPSSLATVITVNQRVKTFADIAGTLPIGQGGTGAITAETARKNLGLAAVAHTANFYDLINIPPLIHALANTGSGIGILRDTINGLSALRTLTSDGTLSIAVGPSGNTVDLSVAAVPVEKFVGVLSPEHGGTGLGTPEISSASAGDVLTLTSSGTFQLVPVPSDGHIIYDEATTRLPQRTKLRFEGPVVEVTDDAIDDATVVTISGQGGSTGAYYTHLFYASEFEGNVLTIQQSAFPFTLSNPILCLRDANGAYVEAGITVNESVSVVVTAQPFDGKLILCEPGGTGFGLFVTYPFTADQFTGNQLVVRQRDLTVDILDPMLAVLDATGTYVSTGLSIVNHVSITLTAKPFDGRLVVFRGDLERVRGGHRIIGPSGAILPDRDELQFAGDGVQSVNDSAANNRTVVTISGGGSGGGANLAALDFAAADFAGTTLTIPASSFPFAYTTPIVQVTNASGRQVLIDTAVDPTTYAITLTGEPFAGKLILMSN